MTIVTQELSRAVAAEIRRLMEARGISGYAISKATGIPQSSISRKLNVDDAASFDLDDVQKISAMLGVEPEDLIAWARRHERSHPPG